MKVAVWDTYVTKSDGSVMHFDIIVPDEVKDETKIYNYGKEYLANKDVTLQSLSSKECQYCHSEYIKPEWEQSINTKGYFIIEMENCSE